MRLLIFGETGQLARELARTPLPEGWDRRNLGRASVDITDKAAVTKATREYNPDILINAAAYTAVDQAEENSAMAFAVNRDAARHIAHAAAVHSVPVLHISTDYVFDGAKSTAYVESDPICPLGVYGESKEAGEQAVRAENDKHVILRTSWVYSPFGNNFVRTMLRLMRERDSLGIVDDQYGCPTAAADLAAVIQGAAEAINVGTVDLFGTFHASGSVNTSEGYSWCDFAMEIQKAAATVSPDWTGRACALNPIETKDYPTPAARPKNSVLDCKKLQESCALSLPDWRESVAKVVRELHRLGEF
jgi:dTDP-4-dehydrorhamnose reductase